MYGHVGFKDSYTPGNGYQFHCPTVDRDALYIACIFMREKFMKGKDIPANDCRCAMSGSKCPAMRMMQMEWATGERQFYDAQPTKHLVPKTVMEQIERVVLLPSHAVGHPLTPEQAKRLFEEGIVTRRVGGDAAPTSAPVKSPRKREAKPVEAPTPAASLPIASDMSELLNQAMQSDNN